MPSMEWWRNHTVKFTSKPHKFLKGKRVITNVQVKENQKMGISGDWFNPCEHSVTKAGGCSSPKMTVFDKDNNEVVTIDTLEKMYKQHKASISSEIGKWLLDVVFVHMVTTGNFTEVTVRTPKIKGCSNKMLVAILLDKGFEGVLITNEDYIVLTLPKDRFS